MARAISLMVPKKTALAITGYSERDFDEFVKSGTLPQPVKMPSGEELWHRKALESAIDLIAGVYDEAQDRRFGNRPQNAIRRYR